MLAMAVMQARGFNEVNRFRPFASGWRTGRALLNNVQVSMRRGDAIPQVMLATTSVMDAMLELTYRPAAAFAILSVTCCERRLYRRRPASLAGGGGAHHAGKRSHDA